MSGLRRAAGVACPRGDVGPVPRGASADGPTGFGEDAAGAPLVDGAAFDAEAFGDFGESYGFGVHGATVRKVLTVGKGVRIITT